MRATIILLAAFLLTSFLFLKAGEKEIVTKTLEFVGNYDVEAIFTEGVIVHHSFLYANDKDKKNLTTHIRKWIGENSKNRVILRVDGQELQIAYKDDENRMYYVFSLPKTDF